MYDIKKLKQLREETGISFSSCKKALEETSNDIEKSKKLLLKWGAKTITEKQERSTSQGAIFSYVHHNKKVASLVELMCETDFVAGNSEFVKLGQELAMQAASYPQESAKEFLSQEYVRDPSLTVNDLIKKAIVTFGENIKVNRVLRWQLGQ